MNNSIKVLVGIGIILVLIPVIPMLRTATPDGGIGQTLESSDITPEAVEAVRAADQIIQDAFDSRRSKLQVQGKAVVYRLLSDDLDGSRHQRILLRLTTGLSLLIAHNIDLAPRLNGIQVGDTVEFYGVYEWNEKGGVVHWTHHDPRGRHVGGWLMYNGRTYE